MKVQIHIPKYVVLEKPVGLTPLETVSAWKHAHQDLQNTPASYAGRLDPMASGALLVLLGDECKQQKSYTQLDKEYEIEVLLDIGTDTGDVLGLANYSDTETHPSLQEIAKTLPPLLGTHLVPYPIFSSKTLRGKPLFMHTLEGGLSPSEIPTHEEHIYSIKLSGVNEITKNDLRERIRNTLLLTPHSDEPSKRLGADFRINAVTKQWHEVFDEIPERSFYILTLTVTCGTGTYMRTLANRIAKGLATSGLALSIHRTKIGRYQPVLLGFGFWKKLFRISAAR